MNLALMVGCLWTMNPATSTDVRILSETNVEQIEEMAHQFGVEDFLGYEKDGYIEYRLSFTPGSTEDVVIIQCRGGLI